MTADKAISRIEGGNIAPVYFLHGEEAFFHTEILSALSERLMTPDNREFNFETYDPRNSTASDWIAAAKTFSFFGDIKLVVVRDLDEVTLDDDAVKIILDYISEPAPESCLVLTALKPDKKRKLFKSLAKSSWAVECVPPREPTLISWLKNRATAQGYTLSTDAARLMVNRIGAKNGILASELEKVLTYAGKEKKVSEKEVAELVGEIRLENIFALTQALKEKKSEKALRLLYNQLDHGEEPIHVLGTIAWQFRTIWEVKHHKDKKVPAFRIAEKMEVKPFVVEKALEFTGNFSHRSLKQGFEYLANADLALKTTNKDPQGIMEILVLKLCSSRVG